MSATDSSLTLLNSRHPLAKAPAALLKIPERDKRPQNFNGKLELTEAFAKARGGLPDGTYFLGFPENLRDPGSQDAPQVFAVLTVSDRGADVKHALEPAAFEINEGRYDLVILGYREWVEPELDVAAPEIEPNA